MPDTLSLTMYAALIAVSIAVAIDVPLGLISRYFRKWIDGLIMRTNDALMSFPALMLAVTIVGILGSSVTNPMLAVGIVYAPAFRRHAATRDDRHGHCRPPEAADR
jgi:peptide/nickel transport system permease protein